MISLHASPYIRWMKRYFIELAYKGKGYAGFQVQQNAITIQSEVEKALQMYYRESIALTGSSRTDAGVHALQNFFHFDFAGEIKQKSIYNLNAILPAGIVIKSIIPVRNGAHCRFDATSREYRYYIYQQKDPFVDETAYYYPYTLDVDVLQEAAGMLMQYSNFESFSKRGTQVKTFECRIEKSEWLREEGLLVYNVIGNRFLRGMVRGLVATMLQVGRKKISLTRFREIIDARDNTVADFSVPGHGLFLVRVGFREGYFEEQE